MSETNEPQQISYPLSPVQNEMLGFYAAQTRVRRERFEVIRRELQHAEELLRQAATARDIFTAYIVKEFGLPKTKEGYRTEETEPGVFRLVGEELDVPDSAAAEPDTKKGGEDLCSLSDQPAT